jgi:hypothetical protein
MDYFQYFLSEFPREPEPVEEVDVGPLKGVKLSARRLKSVFSVLGSEPKEGTKEFFNMLERF